MSTPAITAAPTVALDPTPDSTTLPFNPGDVNDDGTINSVDVLLVPDNISIQFQSK